MAQALTQEGRFKARPKSWVVEENKHGTLQLAMTFGILEAWTGAQWEDWSDTDLEKIGWFYLAKKDGQPNESCLRSLREALGWDGVDLEALQNTDWSSKTVQITTGFEEYEGQRRLKIKFINPEHWEGVQSKPLDVAALRSLSARWGPKLRALAPKPPPSTPSSTPAPAKAGELSPKAAAWKAFCAGATACLPDITREKLAAEWTRAKREMFGNKIESEFTAQDWAALGASGEKVIPI